MLCLQLMSRAQGESTLEISSTSTNIRENTRLKLLVQQGVNAKNSLAGDFFMARVLQPFYSQNDGRLLVASGSWVTGRVLEAIPPTRFSKAGRLSLQLDYLTTVNGEMTPLDAVLSFKQGKVNKTGELDPQTTFSEKALQPTKELLGSDKGKIISTATLGVPVAATLLGGSIKAVFSKGDNIGLLTGESFEIEIRGNGLNIKQ